MAAERRLRPDPLQVLRALGSESRVPEGAGERVQSRLAATLLTQDGLDPFSSPPLLPKAAAAAAPVGKGVLAALWQSPGGKAVILGFTASVGAGAHALWGRPVTQVVYVDRPVAVASAPLAAPAVSAAELVAPSVTELAAPLASASVAELAAPVASAVEVAASRAGIASGPEPSRSPQVRAESLKVERALLDAVRRSLSNGDAAGALARLHRYEQAFPRGKLTEERDALRVNALVIAGSHVEARQAAATFRRNYPQSFLMPSVDAALAAIPAE